MITASGCSPSQVPEVLVKLSALPVPASPAQGGLPDRLSQGDDSKSSGALQMSLYRSFSVTACIWGEAETGRAVVAKRCKTVVAQALLRRRLMQNGVRQRRSGALLQQAVKTRLQLLTWCLTYCTPRLAVAGQAQAPHPRSSALAHS